MEFWFPKGLSHVRIPEEAELVLGDTVAISEGSVGVAVNIWLFCDLCDVFEGDLIICDGLLKIEARRIKFRPQAQNPPLCFSAAMAVTGF